jgi:hypothetical protein
MQVWLNGTEEGEGKGKQNWLSGSAGYGNDESGPDGIDEI